MPHLTIEVSQNLKSKIDISKLLSSAHESIEHCDDIDMNRLKTRLIPTETVLNGKDQKSIQMIHATLALLSGRDMERRAKYGKILLSAIVNSLSPEIAQATDITVEVRNMEKDCYQKY